MKKNLILSVLFVYAMLGVAFTDNVSAQTKKSCEPDKTTLNYSTGISATYSTEISATYSTEASANVVINEVYGGSETDGAYNADFIELYNLSATPVNISDYSLQYYTAGQINAGAPTHTAHIPAATILAGNSFYVIRISPVRSSGASLPCESLNASATFAETGIAADGGKIVLSSTGADLADCTSTLNVVDRVGYGITPIVCSETANAGAPSSSISVQRRAGAADTDNNSADFIATSAPTPCAQLLAPTAAMVNVGGRVTNAYGRGISKALIRMTDSAGIILTAYTSKSGFYNFSDVEVGQTLIFDVKAKRYNFTEPTRIISLNEELTTVNFTTY